MVDFIVNQNDWKVGRNPRFFYVFKGDGLRESILIKYRILAIMM